jgi:hypothetical protein
MQFYWFRLKFGREQNRTMTGNNFVFELLFELNRYR